MSFFVGPSWLPPVRLSLGTGAGVSSATQVTAAASSGGARCGKVNVIQVAKVDARASGE